MSTKTFLWGIKENVYLDILVTSQQTHKVVTMSLQCRDIATTL